MARQKIAILGGGISALTAAHELTDYPGWQDRYDITIYTLGWRLGGKMATGRGIHDRIEERGIHIFQGWYDNAFRMIKSAYAEQAEKGLAPDSPLKTWKDAFIPDYLTLFTEWSQEEGRWLNWPVLFPANDMEPGTDIKCSEWDIIRKGLGIALQLVLGTPYQQGIKPVSSWMEDTFFDYDEAGEVQSRQKEASPLSRGSGILSNLIRRVDSLEDAAEQLVEKTAKRVGAKVAIRFLPDAAALAERIEEWKGIGPHPFEGIVGHFSRFMRWMETGIGHLLQRNNKIRRIMSILGWMEANLKGMLTDLFDPATGKFDYHRINDYDYRDWLRKHGASQMVLDSAPVRFMYTGSFANLHNGMPSKIAADIGLRMVMLSVSYKGSLVWKLAAGTGDTLIAPMYNVLKDRGVKFRFFHKVEEVMHSDTGEIEEVRISEQVSLRNPDAAYEPTIMVNGLHAWPAAPLYDQIDAEQASRLRAEDIDLECPWTSWKSVATRSLRKGEDFDRVILAIPAAALKDICPGIISRNERWKAMVDNVLMVPTFNVQLWMKPSLPEMGMNNKDWGIADDMEPNSVVYANPLYSWTGMSLIIPQENFPEGNKPKHLSYYCGTYRVPDLPPYTDHEFPKRELIRLKALTEQWLQDNMGWYLPKATSPEYPQGFDFNLLYDADEDTRDGDTGLRKFNRQHFKLNIDPSSLFALAWPGTDKYRFRADATDFSNLFVCGDWTDIGLNIGHMEAAVIGGLHAAQAIMKQDGITELKKVLGEAEAFAQ
jgi:uncharacterized protein with NAD-binding domain and iron-sulfur cluster